MRNSGRVGLIERHQRKNQSQMHMTRLWTVLGGYSLFDPGVQIEPSLRYEWTHFVNPHIAYFICFICLLNFCIRLITCSPMCNWKARKYIMHSMGERYAEGVILDLEKTWEESDPRTPLICFLSMGSDPTDSIIALGKRQRIETRYVSMGQGQEVHARKLLQHSMANVCS